MQHADVLLDGAVQARTDGAGHFTFAARPGAHTLIVRAPGHRAAGPLRLTPAAGDTLRLTITLHPAPVTMPDVVVTASRAPAVAGEVPASVDVVSGDEVAARSAITMEDVLSHAAGVTFNGGQMDIRGATGLALGVGSRVLMLLDGHRVLDGTTGEIDFDALPLLDIERIEIVKGPHSALYGSGALGGVVNVITREAPAGPRTTVRLHGGVWDHPDDVAYTSGLPGLGGLDALHERRMGQAGVSVFVGHKRADGFRENGEYTRWLGRARVRVPVGGVPWDAFVNAARDDHGEFVTWRDAAAPYEVEAAVRGDWLRSDKFTAGLTAGVAAGDAMLRFRPQVHYTRVQNAFASDSNFHQATRLGGEALAARSLGPGHALTVGVDGYRTMVRSNFVGNHEVADVALFAQDEIRLGPRWTVSLGARLDRHGVTDGRAETAVTPRVGTVVRLTPGVSVRASVSRGYRAPSVTEQFVSTTLAGFRVIPNPDLGGETALAAEVGASAGIGARVRLDAGVFHSVYDDLVEPAAVAGQFFTFQFRNVTEARVSGLDLSGEVVLVPGLARLEAAYLLLDARDTGRGQPLPYRSRHTVASTLTVGPAAVDVRFRSRVDRVLVFPLDDRGDITVVDLRGGLRLGPHVTAQLKVANVFNAIYPDVRERRAAPPRSVLVNMTGTF